MFSEGITFMYLDCAYTNYRVVVDWFHYVCLLSIWTSLCVCVSVDCVFTNSFRLWIFYLIEKMECYLDVDWFLDVRFVWYMELLLNLIRGFAKNNQKIEHKKKTI